MNKGLYVHIPFCVKKCPYCDFYSQTDMKMKAAYTKALIEELGEYGGENFDTVFIGGGTPTSIGDELIRLCAELPKADEFTVETNPGAVTPELLRGLRAAGANRLSIGVQSFRDNELKALGRIHTARQARDTFFAARKAGFENISIDLMLATPYQTLESVKHSLDEISALSPEHVSAYSLILEEGTPFYGMELPLPDEDEEREIYWYVCEFLDKLGLKQYEISNFARAGYECRHNLKYWSGLPYVGIGAAACSYNDGLRYGNAPDIEAYIRGEGRKINSEAVTAEERLREKFWLGLRKTGGIDYYGEFPETVDALVNDGLLRHDGGKIALTQRGIDLANRVFAEFV